MKAILKIILEGIKTKLTLASYIALTIGIGFLLLYANNLLARTLNDYLMVFVFEGFAMQLSLTVGMFVLVYGMNLMGSYIHVDFEYGAIIRLTHHFMSRLLHTKQSYYANRPSAEIYTSLWTSAQASGKFFGTILRMISNAVVFVFYGIVVFHFDIWAGVFTVVAMPVYFLCTAGLGNRASVLQRAYVGHISELATVAQEAIENVANVKAKNAYAFFLTRTVVVLKKIKGICVKVLVIQSYTGNIAGLIRIVAPLLIIFAAMRFSSGFEANAGNIMVLYINIPLFLNGFADIHRGYMEYKMSKPFLSKLQEFNDTPLEAESGAEIAAFESLQTKAVKVTFDGGRVVAVPDFEINKGEKVMFYGESGIGKSTVFNIVFGFQEYEGDVFINGIDLRDISLASLRKLFGVTFQHTNALTLDLRENISLGASIDDAKLEKLIRLTALESQHDVKGDAILNNKVLSGGEKSRVGLAQMLAAGPEIMLIDEAFSSIDEALESKIITDLFREYPDCAILCISHRNSSKPFFDRVIDFNAFLFNP